MKLLYCPYCQDVFSLNSLDKQCSCGRTHGHYKPDGVHAIYNGIGIPLGIANDSFDNAISEQAILNKQTNVPYYGRTFHAWVVPANSDTFFQEN